MKKLVDIFDFNGEFDLLELKIKYTEKFITEFCRIQLQMDGE